MQPWFVVEVLKLHCLLVSPGANPIESKLLVIFCSSTQRAVVLVYGAAKPDLQSLPPFKAISFVKVLTVPNECKKSSPVSLA